MASATETTKKKDPPGPAFLSDRRRKDQHEAYVTALYHELEGLERRQDGAKRHGDKDQQSFVEARIRDVEDEIRRAEKAGPEDADLREAAGVEEGVRPGEHRREKGLKSRSSSSSSSSSSGSSSGSGGSTAKASTAKAS